ncbi:RNA polymerase sigma-70 factor [Labilibaculum antarcticum]|uniref:RNA polymerase sigma-70 factor, ECF subfamily n=1 Tax=Labilibaculum antarcticum TaxID=1717717 RepID=A0A1Y1CPP7_9BACT|nr:RNA polymerase sigma-70 factor [Labilibaculum antarcticum]BAX82408.1 RNA polymerase sigma-70 factor, ECF subfamily [Labilibaculum antarcticum]
MTTNTDIKDQTLVIQLKDGSQLAFKQLFDRYTPRIYRFAISYLKSDADAEELVQDVFLKLWEKRETLDESQNIRAYIFKIAINSIYNLSKRKNYKQVYNEFVKNNFTLDNEFTWNDVVYNELVDSLNLHIDKMPAQRRDIFLMSRKDGLSNQEIAKNLNISLRTVENQIYRSVSYLREQLKPNSVFLLLLFFLNS